MGQVGACMHMCVFKKGRKKENELVSSHEQGRQAHKKHEKRSLCLFRQGRDLAG